jgi:hypothetical protein
VRRTVTWLLIGAVAALGLAAAVDAVRPEPEQTNAAEKSSTTVPELSRESEAAVRRLREAGISGVLTYSDEDCRLRAVSLPELEPVRAPSFAMCRPATSTRGVTAIGGDVVWAGLGYGVAEVVLSQKRLSRVVRHGLGFSVDADVEFRAVRATGLEHGRYVALADSTDGPAERVLAGFQGRRALFVHPGWWVGDARAIRPSSTGRYYALLGRDLPLFTSDGHEVGIPAGVPPVQAVAWSPDDRWTAVATQASVYIFPSEDARDVVVRIPLTVHDLDWASVEGSSSP